MNELKCKLFGCERLRTPTFPSCSMNHGVQLKEEIKMYNGYKDLQYFSSFKDHGLDKWSINKMEYYANQDYIYS